MSQNLTGTVISVPQQKTAKVAVERRYRHPRYQKVVSQTRKFLVHSDIADIKSGDQVIITACRPVSKSKKFRISAKVS